jgi:hypothetical protein
VRTALNVEKGVALLRAAVVGYDLPSLDIDDADGAE